MNEASKAMRRRMREDDALVFPWREILQGRGVDLGCGPDKLPFMDCIGFDQADGDANNLSRYFASHSFDYIHASHLLEHLHNPKESLREWATLLKNGGFVVITVPDVGAFEDFTFPSVKNPDHKASFSMIYRGSVFPIHYHIPTLLNELSDIYTCLLARYVEVNLNWNERRSRDLTWNESEGCEMWNEVVLQKK